MTQKEKAIAVISGGLDSFVALAAALREFNVILGITYDYGQHAAKQEIEAASAICRHYAIEHREISLPFWKNLPDVALVSSERSIPEVEIADLHDITRAQPIDRSLWVPNRNGVFVHVAAIYAEALDAPVVVTGFNREEGMTFPDNSADFVRTMNENLKYSTLTGVRVECPTAFLVKKEIVELGIQLNVPVHLLYSCYHGNLKMCGKCPSCVRCKEAFRAANVFHLIRDRFEHGI